MTICIQCSMRALLAGEAPPVFDETTEQHMARCHPDPLATYRERQHLEAMLYRRGMSEDGEAAASEAVDHKLAKSRGAYRADEDES